MKFNSRYSVFKNTKNRIINLSTALVLAVTSMSGAAPLFFSQNALAAGVGAVPAYSTVPATMPGSFVSLGYQATQTSELGDYIQLGGTGTRIADSVDVSLTNWACENDATRLSTEACLTSDGSTYSHPVTLNLYNVDNSGTTPAVGSLIKSVTKSVAVPYRPSYDPTNCAASDPATNAPFGGKWYDSVTGTCTNGKAFTTSFDLSSYELTLPNDVIATVAFSTAGDGPFDSLNVSLASTGPTVGVDVDDNALFWNTSFAPNYTDGGAAGVGTLRQDDNWAPYTPVMQVNVLPVPSTVYVDANYTVSSDGSHIFGYDAFSTVQDGVNAVAAGGTVSVAAGTYTGAINVTKPASIVGAGVASTIFNITSNTTYGQGVSVNGQNGVTISNMTFNAPVGTPVSYAFQAYQSSNVTLTNLVFNGPGKSTTPRFGGVDFNSVNGVTINNVTSRNFSKNGFSFTSRYAVSDQLTQNVSLTGITADNNNWAGVAFYTVGNDHSPTSIGGTGDINGVSFNGANTVTNNTKGIEVVGDSDANIAASAIPRWGVTGVGTSVVSLAGVTFTGNSQDVVSKQKYSLYQPSATPGAVEVTIPAGTTVTATGGTWDGVINAPVVQSVDSVTIPGLSGYTTTPVMVIEVGSDTVSLTFDKAVQLVFPGQAGKQVGFFKNGVFTEIANDCSQYLPSLDANLPAGGDCKTTDGSGNLVVWTKHFTTFATFTRTAIPASTSSSSTTKKTTVAASASSPASAAVENVASVLGISSGVAGDATKTPATTNKSNQKTDDSSAFLILGWYWLLVLAVAGILGYAFLARRADRA
ncbi:MAG: hypothetical protein JWN82_334 [Candidatus Saccharibacteria bacterium]|nr:hypothetical protein [Candidatus Saccharibacteria bacterium]